MRTTAVTLATIMTAALLCGAAQRAEPKSVVVAADGSGDFRTVQAAIDSAGEGGLVIRVRPGRYKERVVVEKERRGVTIKGEGEKPGDVVIWYDLYASSVIPPSTQPVGTTGSTGFMINADDFTAENLTFENPSGDKGQAVAVKTNSDRVAFRNCRFLGGQDTLYPNGGRTYFADCYIEGRADFIFGRATAVFERCELHSKNGGFVTAPSTLPETKYGFVFLDSKLTGEGEKAYLGRPWRDYGSTVLIRCEIGEHIRPEGWHNWTAAREKTARFAEYKCTGPGADRSQRVAWAKELSDEEAKEYAVERVLGDWDPRTK